MSDLIIIIILLVSLILGGNIGYLLAKFLNVKQNRKQLKNAIEVLEGKRENFIEIDGVKYNATKFKVRDDEGKEIVIDLKKLIEEDKKKSKKNQKTKEENIPRRNILQNIIKYLDNFFRKK